MQIIVLTQGQFSVVDDWWFEYLGQWLWHAVWHKDTKSFYAARSEGGKHIYMHRVVAQTPDNMLCDHIHHLTLDNRESQLRNVTPEQSQMNRRIHRNNELGVAGVSKRTRSGTYRATLHFQGDKVLDKTFKTLDEAEKAHKEAKAKYFGEYANQD